MKPLIVKDYREMYTAIKTGKSPEPEKPKHTRWSIYYGKMMLEENLSYAICVNKIKVYKQFGRIYPKKELFKILPFKNK